MGRPLKRIAILGSTGSIGRQTLDVIRANPDRYQVVALAAGTNLDLLAEQIAEFSPAMFCCAEPSALDSSSRIWPQLTTTVEIAREPTVDIVVSAVVGSVGLEPAIAALEAGKPVAIANKEAMVMAGHLIAEAAQRGGGELRPVDSEHSAIWQCLRGHEPSTVERLLITASGGALRDLPSDSLASVTPAVALAHPTWTMGRRITIDSATLFNKGLEVIEARWLFDVPFERIEVVMHRESIVHSLVELVDGSMFAHLSSPDMRLPILHALSYPERLPLDLPRLDLARLGALHFGEPDLERYPCLGLALAAGQVGGTAPAAIAAADEEAVEAFLDRRLRFLDIPALLTDTLATHISTENPCLDEILEADAWGRRFAKEWIQTRC